MVCNKVLDINLDEFASKPITLPANPARYIEVNVINENAAENQIRLVEHKALPFARTDVKNVPIKSAKVLCDGEGVKKVMEISFDVQDTGIDFLPGDTIGILPKNRSKDVDFLLHSLNLDLDSQKQCTISIMKTTQKKLAKVPAYLPTGATTIRTILENYLNIYFVPKKLFIRALVDFTSDERDRTILSLLSSKEGAAVYNSFIVENGLCVLDLLRLCPSCKPPLGVLIEHLPRLLPRVYSIANSPIKTPNEIRIVFSILEERQKGLTTEMLERATARINRINLYCRTANNFAYTEDDLNRNIVMISIGCGISPFIGFVEHKYEMTRNLRLAKTDYKTWLFSGSRYRRNAVYRDQFKEFRKLGVIDEYFESFSREPDAEFRHVQEQIVTNTNRFVELISSPDTKVFVCADGKDISKTISSTIVDCMQKVFAISAEDANAKLKDMKSNCRYIEDVWL